jgi:hypothetical protein
MKYTILTFLYLTISLTTLSQTFPTDNFGANCTCNLLKEPDYMGNNSVTNYKCADIDKRVIYRVSVSDLSADLKKLNLSDFNKPFIDGYFKKYKENLNKDNVSFKETTFQGSYAIVYSLNIQQEGSIMLKNMSIIFLHKKKSYTISAITTVEEVEQCFSSFSKSFYFINN